MPLFDVRLAETHEAVGRYRADDPDHLWHIIDEEFDPTVCEFIPVLKANRKEWVRLPPVLYTINGYGPAYAVGLNGDALPLR